MIIIVFIIDIPEEPFVMFISIPWGFVMEIQNLWINHKIDKKLSPRRDLAIRQEITSCCRPSSSCWGSSYFFWMFPMGPFAFQCALSGVPGECMCVR